MAERISVEAVMIEETHIGEVAFPVAIPECLVDWLVFPDDLRKQADALGLDVHTVRFLLGALRGKWSVTASVDLPDLAGKVGLSFAEMDQIVRDLIEKNYARLAARLDLYRLWIVILHLKDIRFVVE